MIKRFLLPALLILSATPAWAEVRLPAIFSDHMVVQQDKPLAIWGWANAGEEVTITLGDAAAKATPDVSGKWSAKLDKIKPSARPLTLTVKGGNTLTANDVLVGEVWLCSGQSNMAFQVARTDRTEQEQAAANFPQIRMFTVARNPKPEVQAECQGKWEVCSPATVKNFSAVAYFFGRELHQKLGVPVGLINSSYGGTDIAAWTSFEPQAKVPELIAQMEQWERQEKTYDPDKAKATYEKQLAAFQENAKKAKADGKPAPRRPTAPVRPSLNQNRPTNLFNGMIAPLIPYTIRGAIWYQGEHNSGSDADGLLYRKQLPMLIADWRQRWGDEMPFGFVQLPNFTRKGEGWQLVREAMLKTLMTVPKTGMAVIVDVGNPNDVHPTDKQTVGKRLAMWALGDIYGQAGVATCGPTPASHDVRGGEMVITFKHADGGLTIKANTNAKADELQGFTIAGEDGKFVPAKAKIEGDKVIVSAPGVSKPTAVRYAWQDNPACNLYNGQGIPASPFRTNDK
jgi:hypothetical protein